MTRFCDPFYDFYDEAGQKESDIINCVFYYEKGTSGSNFIRKEKFRAVLSKGEKTLKKTRETVTVT